MSGRAELREKIKELVCQIVTEDVKGAVEEAVAEMCNSDTVEEVDSTPAKGDASSGN